MLQKTLPHVFPWPLHKSGRGSGTRRESFLAPTGCRWQFQFLFALWVGLTSWSLAKVDGLEVRPHDTTVASQCLPATPLPGSAYPLWSTKISTKNIYHDLRECPLTTGGGPGRDSMQLSDDFKASTNKSIHMSKINNYSKYSRTSPCGHPTTVDTSPGPFVGCIILYFTSADTSLLWTLFVRP